VAAKFKRILLKLSGEALMGDQGFGICPNMLAYVAEEVRSIVESGCATGHCGRRRQYFSWRGGRFFWHGADIGRSHGHAGHGTQQPGPSGCTGENGTFRPGCRRPFPCMRWPNRTSFAGHCDIWKKDGWSFLPPDPVIPILPPTRRRCCAPRRFTQRFCSKPPRSTGCLTPIPNAISMPGSSKPSVHGSA
jgi:hypothetical protein